MIFAMAASITMIKQNKGKGLLGKVEKTTGMNVATLSEVIGWELLNNVNFRRVSRNYKNLRKPIFSHLKETNYVYCRFQYISGSFQQAIKKICIVFRHADRKEMIFT